MIECFQWKAHGPCSKGDSCSFSHDKLVHGDLYGGQRRKGRSSSFAPNSKAKTNGEQNPQKHQATKKRALHTKGAKFHADSEFVKTRHLSFGILPCVRTTSLKKDVYMATHAISDMLRPKESAAKRSKKSGAKGSVAMLKESTQLGCVSQDSYPRKTILREPKHPSNSPKAPGTKLKFGKERVHREELSKSVHLMSVVLARQILGKDHMRRPRCARKAVWDLARHIYKLKNSDKTSFYTCLEARRKPAPTSIRPEEREFVVDSGASMLMLSKKELTVKRSRNPTAVLTANGPFTI